MFHVEHTPAPTGAPDPRRLDREASPSPDPVSGPGRADGLEAEPAAAVIVFGDALDRVRDFANQLALRGEELGLIGPLELPRLWTRHIVNSGLVAPLVAPGALVGDVGSGAGLPGLVLAIARPDARFVLIEPMERRTDWLRSEADRLGLENVEVVRARAEDAPYAERLDQVTARAVSALRTLIPSVVPLVRRGGELILMKGVRVEEERQAAAKQIAKARLTNIEILTLGDGVTPEVTRVFRAIVG
ncbi:MAG: 16S rRNA (guanine(527)-N(7))-methyltransferase RsmG [Microbacteriaceae bacterium]|nr:16S rRNA (guanine(527)-N(7))-methyltransferase RsmG [Microbacteriaceae bacterium]